MTTITGRTLYYIHHHYYIVVNVHFINVLYIYYYYYVVFLLRDFRKQARLFFDLAQTHSPGSACREHTCVPLVDQAIEMPLIYLAAKAPNKRHATWAQ